LEVPPPFARAGGAFGGVFFPVGGVFTGRRLEVTGLRPAVEGALWCEAPTEPVGVLGGIVVAVVVGVDVVVVVDGGIVLVVVDGEIVVVVVVVVGGIVLVVEEVGGATVGTVRWRTGAVATGRAPAACSAPAVTAPATKTEVAATLPSADATWPSWGTLSTNGSEPSQASGPVMGRSRPIETSRKARTTWGSNCEPAHAASSLRAASGLMARL
jgi:hypothetical protein